MPAPSSEAHGRLIAIGLHDVSPATWPLCERLVELVREVRADAPITLLVVPELHRLPGAAIDAAPREWRAWVDSLVARGFEIALHGLWHLDDGGASPSLRAALARRFLTAGEAEFAALDAAAARARIERGIAMLARCGWAAAGFVPPAWQISEAATAVLPELGFRYTSTLRAFTALPSRERLAVPALGFSARTALRRAASRVWIGSELARLGSARALRIALHPVDARHESTRAAWRALLERALRDRRPVTKSALCAALARVPGAR